MERVRAKGGSIRSGLFRKYYPDTPHVSPPGQTTAVLSDGHGVKILEPYIAASKISE